MFLHGVGHQHLNESIKRGSILILSFSTEGHVSQQLLTNSQAKTVMPWMAC